MIKRMEVKEVVVPYSGFKLPGEFTMVIYASSSSKLQETQPDQLKDRKVRFYCINYNQQLAWL